MCSALVTVVYATLIPCLAPETSAVRLVGLGVTLNAVMTLALPNVLTARGLWAIALLTVTAGPFRDRVNPVTLSGIPLHGARSLTEFLLATMMLA